MVPEAFGVFWFCVRACAAAGFARLALGAAIGADGFALLYPALARHAAFDHLERLVAAADAWRVAKHPIAIIRIVRGAAAPGVHIAFGEARSTVVRFDLCAATANTHRAEFARRAALAAAEAAGFRGGHIAMTDVDSDAVGVPRLGALGAENIHASPSLPPHRDGIKRRCRVVVDWASVFY